jgi:hypothetical protein
MATAMAALFHEKQLRDAVSLLFKARAPTWTCGALSGVQVQMALLQIDKFFL